MDLREHTLSLRCSTWRDLLDDGTALELVDSIEALTGTTFQSSRDLGGRRRRPGRPTPGRVALEALASLGMHAAGRVQLSAADPDETDDQVVRRGLSLQLHAGEHPYTGRFHTTIDLRVPLVRFDQATFVGRYVDWVEQTLVPRTEPFQGHAHDTDDIAVQNLTGGALARAGFGLSKEAADALDPATNPGREVSRGAFRYLASWLMLIGPALREDLGDEAVAGLQPGLHAERIVELPGQVTLVQLTASPVPPDSPQMRTRQLAVREQLGFDARARQTARTWGYWDRKSRT